MAAAPKKTPKTESLTIRLDPKTRFILEFIARIRGQQLTTVIERLIADGGDALFVGNHHNQTWRDFWDVSEGIRSLRVAEEAMLYPTFEEEQRLAFAKEHWPFFYTNQSCTTFRAVYLNTLWPHIDDYLHVHQAHRGANYWHAGRLMQDDLRAANISAPSWPPKSGHVTGTSTSVSEDFTADLDDEIPF